MSEKKTKEAVPISSSVKTRNMRNSMNTRNNLRNNINLIDSGNCLGGDVCDGCLRDETWMERREEGAKDLGDAGSQAGCLYCITRRGDLDGCSCLFLFALEKGCLVGRTSGEGGRMGPSTVSTAGLFFLNGTVLVPMPLTTALTPDLIRTGVRSVPKGLTLRALCGPSCSVVFAAQFPEIETKTVVKEALLLLKGVADHLHPVCGPSQGGALEADRIWKT